MSKIEINYDYIPKNLEPDENIILWRYMDFPSLCEILNDNAIPLINVNSFSDKSEGAILKNILSNLPNSHPEGVRYAMYRYRKMTYVSSWCRSKYENTAMWDRYTKPNNGVAIQTNAKLLLDCFNNIDIASNELFSEERVNERDSENRQGQNSYLLPGTIIKEVRYVSEKPSNFKMGKKYMYSGYDRLCFFYKMHHFIDESEIRILHSDYRTIQKLYEMTNSELIEHINEFKNSTINKKEHIPSFYRNISHVPEVLILDIGCASKLIQKIVISPHTYNSFIDIVNKQINIINFKRRSERLAPIVSAEHSESKDWF